VVPSRRGTKLDDAHIRELREVLAPAWSLTGGHLARTYPFPDFKSGLAFVDHVGRIAETMNHHPNVQLSWGEVRLELWTHDADGLTERDFQLAQQADDTYRRLHPV
jgi:4a-hydroxytetrahydrobiopterin dehydratase